MKKTLTMFAVLMGACLSYAQNPVTVADITIPQNGESELVITYEFPSEGLYTGYSLALSLPEGVSLVQNDKGKYVYTLGDCHEDTHQLTINYNEDSKQYGLGCLSLESDPLTGTNGTLITLTVKADGTLTAGSTLQATVQEVNFAKLDGQTDFFSDVVSFAVTIGEPADTRTVLDETSTTAPEAATGVDVRVKRTIKAGEWSTICLPFAMTEAQCKEAFGSDVQIGDFTGYETKEEENKNIVGISVGFSNATDIKANHPYIIKVSALVTEFIADGVTIEPEDNPSVSFGYSTGKKPVVYHPKDFVGTYVANFDFYNDATSYPLFLNGNKFYYATENTMYMKAFRAYFDFDDVLTEVDDASASRIAMLFSDSSTGISKIESGRLNVEDAVYDLQGRRMASSMFNSQSSILKKGIYVKDGKKVVIK